MYLRSLPKIVCPFLYYRCDNTIGSYACVRVATCGTGYTLNHNTGMCVDDDECRYNKLPNVDFFALVVHLIFYCIFSRHDYRMFLSYKRYHLD